MTQQESRGVTPLLTPSVERQARATPRQHPHVPVDRSPEKAGGGGSIPSLATTLTLLLSIFRRRLPFCLCQICVVRFPNQVILEALKFRVHFA